MLHGVAYMIASVIVAGAAFMVCVAPLVLVLSAIKYVACWIFASLKAT